MALNENVVPEGRSPRSGDLVRATVDNGDRTAVEGALCIRRVPSLNRVQIDVLADERTRSVAPESIEVTHAGAVREGVLGRDDPLVNELGWRRIHDFQRAVDAASAAMQCRTTEP